MHDDLTPILVSISLPLAVDQTQTTNTWNQRKQASGKDKLDQAQGIDNPRPQFIPSFQLFLTSMLILFGMSNSSSIG